MAASARSIMVFDLGIESTIEYGILFCVIFTSMMIAYWVSKVLGALVRFAKMVWAFVRSPWSNREKAAASSNDAYLQPLTDANRDSCMLRAPGPEQLDFPYGTETEMVTVYATKSGNCFHQLGCKWIRGKMTTEMKMTHALMKHKLGQCRTCFQRMPRRLLKDD